MQEEKFILMSAEELKDISRLTFVKNQLIGTIINYNHYFEEWHISQKEYDDLIDNYLEIFMSLRLYLLAVLKSHSINITDFNTVHYDVSLKKIFYYDSQE